MDLLAGILPVMCSNHSDVQFIIGEFPRSHFGVANGVQMLMDQGDEQIVGTVQKIIM